MAHKCSRRNHTEYSFGVRKIFYHFEFGELSSGKFESEAGFEHRNEADLRLKKDDADLRLKKNEENSRMRQMYETE